MKQSKKLYFLLLPVFLAHSTLFSKGDYQEPETCVIATPRKTKKQRKKARRTFTTIDAWYNAIHAYEEFPDDYAKRSPLTIDELLAAVEASTKATENYHEKISWYHDKKLPSKLYKLDKDYFVPYVQKIIKSNAAEIALFGDIHGSVHSVVRDLRQLQKLGWFKDSFKITKPNAYIFFLGDIVDRGKWGAEVLYTIARLKEANPSRVFHIRGNHERLKCKYKFSERKKEDKQNFEFIHELQQKFPDAQKEELEKLFYSYNSLPIAMYLGTPGSPKDFLQISHGAVDLGFDPSKFFTSKADAQRLDIFKRATNLKRLSPESQDVINSLFKEQHAEELNDFKPKGLQDPSRLGLMWHDFIFTGEPLVFDKAGSWNYGRKLFEEILGFGTTKNTTLHGIIRGHEHNFSTYPGLWDTHGALPAWDNKVITIFSGPANFLPSGNKKLIFNYDSFCILTIGKNYKDWRLTHWWREFKTSRKPKSKTGTWQHDTIALPDQLLKKDLDMGIATIGIEARSTPLNTDLFTAAPSTDTSAPYPRPGDTTTTAASSAQAVSQCKRTDTSSEPLQENPSALNTLDMSD